jgi:hypothetical protein
MRLITEWNTFVYASGTPVEGETIDIEMSIDAGQTWQQIAASQPDAESVEFDAPIDDPEFFGTVVLFRARGELAGAFGPYSEPVEFEVPFPPLPAVSGLRVRAV